MAADTVLGPLPLHGMAQGGEAVGRHAGQVVFVQGGLPGELVTVRLSEERPAYRRGVVIEILKPSPERTTPRCSLFGRCGGCHWQHIAYPAQLAYKRAIVVEQCRHLGGIPDPPVAETMGMAEPWGYRSTAELHVDSAGRPGYYAPRSHWVVPLACCPLLVPALDDLLGPLAQSLSTIAPADRPAHVTLRYSWAERRVLALFSGGTPAGMGSLAEQMAARLPEMIWQHGRREQRLAGRGYLHETLGGANLRISPTSFFQVNVPQAERLLATVREMLSPAPGDHLLDAYAGVGALSLPLAGQVARVTAVEVHPAAVADLRENARRLAEGRVEVIAGPVEGVLAGRGRFDLAILDPPRRGCAPGALRAFLEARPRRLVYVSCHPGTLARDLRVLQEGGYRLRQVQPLDLFPQTFHVESAALLEGPP